MTGHRLRFLTAGESHGPRPLGILDAGSPRSAALVCFHRRLPRSGRQGGVGRGARMKIERDRVEIVSGVWKGATSGAPVGIAIENRSVIPQDRQPVRTAATRPRRPDRNAEARIRRREPRDRAFEQAETAARVAGWSRRRPARARCGGRRARALDRRDRGPSRSGRLGEADAARDRSLLACADPEVEDAMLARIAEAKEKEETLGGGPKSSRSACRRAGIVRPVGTRDSKRSRRGASLHPVRQGGRDRRRSLDGG